MQTISLFTYFSELRMLDPYTLVSFNSPEKKKNNLQKRVSLTAESTPTYPETSRERAALNPKGYTFRCGSIQQRKTSKTITGGVLAMEASDGLRSCVAVHPQVKFGQHPGTGE